LAFHIRDYQLEDRASCLAILQDHIPDLFAPGECGAFADFLDGNDAPYFIVIETRGVLIACGGVRLVSEPTIARLVWGIVDREYHRQGVGRLLLLARLNWLAQHQPHVRRVELHTSQYVRPFFESAGFVVDTEAEHGYAPGLHRYDLHMDFDAARRAQVVQQYHLIRPGG
jgi:GNAT superfamily N-acetyltransferase